MAGLRHAAGHARVRRRGPPVPLARAGGAAHARRASSSAAERRGLTGLAASSPGSSASTRSVIDELGVVDFAGLLQRAAALAAGEGEPLFDHVLVDDYQDTTLAGRSDRRGPARARSRRRGRPRRPTSSRSRGRPGAARPVRRGVRRAPAHDRARHEPSDRRRAGADEAWVAPHTVRGTRRDRARAPPPARRGRRGVGRHGRGGAAPGCAPRRAAAGARRRAHPACDPRTRALAHRRARHPPVRARAALAGRRRDPARGAGRAAASPPTWWGSRPPSRAGCCAPLATDTGSIAERARRARKDSRPTSSRRVAAARETLAKAALFAGMSVQDAFRHLWEQLPCSRRLVERAGDDAERPPRPRHRRDVRERGRRDRRGAAATRACRRSWNRSTPASTGPATRRGSARATDAVQVLTAHGTVGREFDTVLVTGVDRGELPEPLAARADVRPGGARPRHHRTPSATATGCEDERRLFGMVMARAQAARGAHVRATSTLTMPTSASRAARASSPTSAWSGPAPAGPVRRAGVRP